MAAHQNAGSETGNRAATTAHKAIRIVAYVLVVAAFFYIGRAIWAYREWLLNWQASAADWLLISISVLIYGGAGLLLSASWAKLNRICDGGAGPGILSAQQSTAIYGTSQIAKYVPGNVFHFVGRHAAGVQAGLSHSVLACSASMEMLGLIFSAGILSLSGVLIPEAGLLALLSIPLWGLLGVLVFCILVMLWILPRLLKRMGVRSQLNTPVALMRSLAPAILLHLMFFMLSGMLVAGLVFAVVDDPKPLALLLAFSSYPVSWLAGYVIPGASAGVGIREASMMLILSDAILPQEATLVAILMRVVTVLGDLVFFAYARYVGSSIQDSLPSRV